MRILFLESVAGIAGDMFAAAFLDAGLLDPESARSVPGALGLKGVRVEPTAVKRIGMAATHLRVEVPGEGARAGHGHTHYPDLDALLAASDLPAPAVAFARKVYRILAEAEAGAHGCEPEEVSFHEVGDLDSVVDVALAGLCVAATSPERVVATPVKLGRGTIGTRHGPYPVPPPASAGLAAGMPVAPVPDTVRGEDVELSTPTGLAILKALEPDFRRGWPPGTVRAQGMGAGSRDLGGYPNVFRVVLLEGEGEEEEGGGGSDGTRELPFETDRVVEVSFNVDDQTGERTGWLIRRCLDLGALDAWAAPVTGKKGRPALCFTVLASPEEAPRLSDWLLRHSATFGVRYSTRERLKLVRSEEVRETPGGKVRFSVGRTTEGEVLKEKPEFDDLERIWEEDPDLLS